MIPNTISDTFQPIIDFSYGLDVEIRPKSGGAHPRTPPMLVHNIIVDVWGLAFVLHEGFRFGRAPCTSDVSRIIFYDVLYFTGPVLPHIWLCGGEECFLIQNGPICWTLWDFGAVHMHTTINK